MRFTATEPSLMCYLPYSIVRTIYPGTTVISQQLRTVPPYVVGAFFVIFFPFLSWKTDRRLIYMIISAPLIMVSTVPQ